MPGFQRSPTQLWDHGPRWRGISGETQLGARARPGTWGVLYSGSPKVEATLQVCKLWGFGKAALPRPDTLDNSGPYLLKE